MMDQPQTLYERGIEFVKPRNKSSKVWKYFGQRVVDGKLLTKEEVVCLVCFNTYRTCGSTSPMFSHLMKMHPNEYAQINCVPLVPNSATSSSSINLPRVDLIGMYTSSRNAIPSANMHADHGIEISCETDIKCSQPSSSATKVYDQSDNRQQKITNLVIDVLVENMLSPSVVNSNSFHKLMNLMDPSYIIPDKKTISKVIIPNRYNETKECLKLKISALASFSYSINRCITSNGNEYLLFSIHSIADDWTQTHYLTNVIYIPKSMSFNQMTLMMKEQIQQMQNGFTHVIAATTDSSDVLNASVKTLGHTHLPCLASVIQKAVTEEVYGVDHLRFAIEKCKQIAPLLHHSVPMKLALTSEQLEKGNEVPKSCPIFDDRRWNSIFSLLTYCKGYFSIINDILVTHGHRTLVLSEKEQQRIIDCCEMLRPLADAMDLLSNENYVTSSTVMPFLDILKKDILTVQSSDSKETVSLKERLVGHITSVFLEPEVRNLLLQCSFMDPRFKDLNYLKNEEKMGVREAVYNRAKLVSSNISCSSTMQPPVKKPKSSLGQLFSIRGQKDFMSAEDLYDPVDEEISAYVNNECVFEIDGDYLKWWYNRTKMFPILSQVAHQLLSIPATSAPSNYCFKKHGDSMLRKRSSLSPKIIETMILLNESKKM